MALSNFEVKSQFVSCASFRDIQSSFRRFKTLMSTLFETPVLFSICTFIGTSKMNLSIEKERKKTFREAIFVRHYFICLHNKCMRQCMTVLRTDGRTYGHDVITKFSELHGLLPFSLTNGCSASGLRPLELRYNLCWG